MNYKIINIDNIKHTAIIQRDDGKKISLIVPKEHRTNPNTKMAYIDAQIQANIKIDEGPLTVSKAASKIVEKVSDNKPNLLAIVAIVELIAILALVLLRH